MQVWSLDKKGEKKISTAIRQKLNSDVCVSSASLLFCFKAVAFWCLLPLEMGHAEHFVGCQFTQ